MKKSPLFSLLILAALLAGCIRTATPTSPPQPTDTVLPPVATSGPDSTPTAEPEPTATPDFIPYEAPDWFENGVLYEIYVRSFADSDGDGIGDFNGITAKLDYIESLHVDVVWLMPVHPSPSVHGYDVTDFFDVHPDYGTMDDFRNMVAEFHARDIRVIIDFVSSHASNQHPFFQDAYGSPDSAYDDWFRFTNEENTQYEGFANLGTLPRFNHFNPEVKRFMADAALFWLDLDDDGDFTDGVDGFRVDNATFPPKDYFVEWRQQVKRANPDALILGEVWVEQVPVLELYFVDQFDALFNFPMFTLLQGSISLDSAGSPVWNLPPTLLSKRVDDQAREYPAEGILIQFATNHDTDRLASMLNGDMGWEKFAAAVTIILPESFALYYGEEIGMFGVKGGPPHWDSYRREPMDWNAAEIGPFQATWFREPDRWNRPNDGVSVEEQENDPDSLLNTYRRLLELRQSIDALKNGDFVTLDAFAIGRKSWAVSRTSGDQTFVGIFNFGPESVEVTVDGFPFSSEALVDLISGDTFPGSTAGEPYVINLPEAGVVWFVNE